MRYGKERLPSPHEVIIERHKDATPKKVVAWENDGFGKTLVVVENTKTGRRTKIKAANISRYDRYEETP